MGEAGRFDVILEIPKPKNPQSPGATRHPSSVARRLSSEKGEGVRQQIGSAPSSVFKNVIPYLGLYGHAA